MSRTVKNRYYGFNLTDRNPYQYNRSKYKDYWYYYYTGDCIIPDPKAVRRENKRILEKCKQAQDYDRCYSVKWVRNPEWKFW